MPQALSFTLLFFLILFSSNSLAGEPFFTMQFGKATTSNNSYKDSQIGKLGFGRRFRHVSTELNYFIFDRLTIKDASDTYIKVNGLEFNVQGHLDLNWSSLVIGAGKYFYDSEIYLDNTQIHNNSDDGYSANAGLLFRIEHNLHFSLQWDKYFNLADNDINQYTLGLELDF